MNSVEIRNKISNFKKGKHTINIVNDFPVNGIVYNRVYDIKNKLPLFSKNKNSKSNYCAGYYLVNINNNWTTEFNPKISLLLNHEYTGPFKSEIEASSSNINNKWFEL